MSSAIQYQGVFNLNNGRLRIYYQAKDALYKAGINYLCVASTGVGRNPT